MRHAFFFIFIVLVLCLVSPASAGVITIGAKSNIWGAQPSELGDGSIPPYISFAAGSLLWVQFSSITGTVDCDGPLAFCSPSGPDGGMNLIDTQGATGTYIEPDPNSGLSGINYIGREMFLIGVFLTNSVPSGTNPSDIVYDDTLANGAIFSPLLGQLFFIGDGQGSGGMQHFIPPSGATRLYLGFADGADLFGSPIKPVTPPNAYGDNTGSMQATYDLVTPEPGSIFLMGLGVAALALLRRRWA